MLPATERARRPAASFAHADDATKGQEKGKRLERRLGTCGKLLTSGRLWADAAKGPLGKGQSSMARDQSVQVVDCKGDLARPARLRSSSCGEAQAPTRHLAVAAGGG